MTLLEALQAELESRSTYSQVAAAAVTTALGVLLVTNQYRLSPDAALAYQQRPGINNGTADTSQLTQETYVDAGTLFAAISKLHDELMKQQIELDPEVRAVIYADLWNLYD